MIHVCLCGATDCPHCGPAQGYEVIQVPNGRGGFKWVNPETDEDVDEDPDEDFIDRDIEYPGDEDPYYERM